MSPFCVSLSAGNPVSKLKREEKLKNFPGVATSLKSPNCIWYKPNLFVNAWLCSVPDIQMELFLDYIIFLIWAAWILFNFYLKQKQRCFTENVSLISFHEEIWSITKTH